MHRVESFIFAGMVTALSVFPGVVGAAPGDNSLVSVRLPGQTTSMYGGYGARISADGSHLAFFSTSPDLVQNLTNGFINLFVRNLQTGTIAVVPIKSSTSAFTTTDTFSISGTGQFVAFTSAASSVVPGDTNGVGDVFVWDTQAKTIERVSVSSSGAQATKQSTAPSISADGRYVAFASLSANLAPGGCNYCDGVFVHDRQTGQTQRVSVGSAGVQANGDSYGPAISGDGRYVAFASNATNLVAGDTNGVTDIYVRDLQAGTTQRVSVGTGGVQSNGGSAYAAISADGRYVAFSSDATNLVPNDTNGVTDIFVRDRQAGTTERDNVDSSGGQTTATSLGNPSISPDGRYVAFASDAPNLVSGDTNNASDVFVHDRLTGQTMFGSLSSAGVQGNLWSAGGSISTNGTYLGFDSYASNLVPSDYNGSVDVFVRNRQASTLSLASAATSKVTSTAAGALNYLDDYFDEGCGLAAPSISRDGRYVAFISTAPDLVVGLPLPTSPVLARPYVFIRDLQAATTVQVPSQVIADNVIISGDGSTVAVFGNCYGPTPQVVDRVTGAVTLLPTDVFGPAMSLTGQFVAFSSGLSSLVPGDTNGARDIFVLNRQSGTTQRVSVTSGGAQDSGNSADPAITGDGRFVAFDSVATDLVPGDTNGFDDVFVHDSQTGLTERVSVGSSGQETNGDSYLPGISDDGRYVVFLSNATNLVAGSSGNADVFVKDLQTGLIERDATTASRPAITGDGRYVTYLSGFSPFIYDRQTGATTSLLAGGIQLYNFGYTFVPYVSLSAVPGFAAFQTNTSLVSTDLNASAFAPAYFSVSVALDVYVQEIGITSLTVSPKSLAFGKQAIKTVSAAKPVTVTNVTTTAVPITSIKLAGASTNQFAFTSNCGTSLAGNANCTIKVTFKPTAKGSKSATLSVNGGGGGLRTVALTGTGT